MRAGNNHLVNAERFRSNVFFAILLTALGLCLALFWPFWRALAWAVVLAILIYPTHQRIARRLRSNVVAAALSTILTIALIVVPLLLLLAAVTAEGRGLVEQALGIVRDETWRSWAPNTRTGVLADALRWLGRYVDLSQVRIEDVVQRQLSRAAEFLAGNAAGFVQNIARSILQISLALVTLFFILKDGSRLLPAVKAFIPLDQEQTDTVLARAVETMYATFYGVVLVAMIQGTLGGLAFWFLGLPSPLLWGVVMTALCIIPLAGAPIVWVPAVALLAVQGLYVKAIVLGLWGWLVVGLVDNFTRPFIIGGGRRCTRLPSSSPSWVVCWRWVRWGCSSAPCSFPSPSPCSTSCASSSARPRPARPAPAPGGGSPPPDPARVTAPKPAPSPSSRAPQYKG